MNPNCNATRGLRVGLFVDLSRNRTYLATHVSIRYSRRKPRKNSTFSTLSEHKKYSRHNPNDPNATATARPPPLRQRLVDCRLLLGSIPRPHTWSTCNAGTKPKGNHTKKAEAKNAVRLYRKWENFIPPEITFKYLLRLVNKTHRHAFVRCQRHNPFWWNWFHFTSQALQYFGRLFGGFSPILRVLIFECSISLFKHCNTSAAFFVFFSVLRVLIVE